MWNEKFLKFNEKSFCVEDIMMWNAIQNYKSLKTAKSRHHQYCKIVSTFILVGSPLEINIARSQFGIPEIISNYETIKPMTTDFKRCKLSVAVFDPVQVAVEHNMLDSFFRFNTIHYKETFE